ncbi:MAG TPA: ATP-binding protein [Chitinophagaceae bacterium]|nr:ATP-binding protein [Chitinophagaceae bacterium]
MASISGKKLRLITFIYWLLLSYIVAALVWWFISLEIQNREMSTLKINAAYLQASSSSTGQLKYDLAKINNETKRNTAKYISEGITFLILILIGAAFVFRMVRKQFRMQQQQQNFMMAVTHELKTPISVAHLNLETLLRHQLDTEKQIKIIQMTLQETARLNSLTNNILFSSQLEAGRYRLIKEELDFSSLTKDCMLEARRRYPERIFTEQIEEDLEIAGDPLLLQMMINNLLENAVKYSGKEKPIACLLKKNKNTVLLNIIDEGNGIPDKEKKKIFEKFYRTGDEATRKTQGTGLGLYLCSKIAKDHHADIIVTNNTPSGCNFAITFYL